MVGKQILQQMCAENVGWDDPIPESLYMKWEQWRQNLPQLESIQVERCLKPDNFGQVKTVEMHHFSDASTTGYGQCSYLRLIDSEERIHCSLLMSKARVTPLKTMTIPRLELTAALVSVRVSSLLDNELKYEDPVYVFWTDSRVVLGYISNDSKRFHVFVSNRVQQIRDVTDPSQWRYVDTKNNPADIASRGATATELKNSNWLTGPKFLWQADLPTFDTGSEPCTDLSGDPGIRKAQCLISSVNIVQKGTVLERLEYFSEWDRARRAVAGCLRFKELLKQRLIKKPQGVSVSNTPIQSASNYTPSTVEELRRAEVEILRLAQETCFAQELESLSRHTSAGVVPCGGRKTSPRASTIVQFIFYFGPLRSAIIF